MPKLLVVDDEPLICQSFDWVFSTSDVEITTAGTITEARRKFDENPPDVVVLDLQLPDGSGMELFEHIQATDPKRPVIFLTAHGTTQTAIEAMKRGAFDYLGKPFELEHMSALLERAFEAARLMREPAALPEDLPTDLIVGRSPSIREICKQIGRVAPLDVTVLILGESGTGKELVARAIYQHSHRAEKPFLAINCAAIPEGLVESELFGYEPGAFTGAGQRRIGRFEQADRGTLFLDEIGDMPLPVQAKILRFLQDQTFERVGGGKSISTRVRVLAATNHDLEQLIAAGRFRSDLYYRLKEIIIRVPPLRDRSDDIAELAHHFLFQFARESGRDVWEISSDALQILCSHPWPGNVRELRGAIKEAALRTHGRKILAEFLPPGLVNGDGTPASSQAEPPLANLTDRIDGLLSAGDRDIYHRVVGAVERELILRTLRFTGGHLGQACERLGIDRKTLRNKLRELDIAPEKGSADSAEISAE
jgi:two-component system nitrogen regulation response regulator GlnG